MRTTGKAPAALLGDIASSRDWAAIPDLAAYIDIDEVNPAIMLLLHQVPVDAVSQLDIALRQRADYARTAWIALRSEDLPRHVARPGGPALVQIAMCHPSGYVREAAIRFANVCSDGGRELRFLLLRLNDWVFPVQVAAHHAIRARLTTPSATDLIAALPVLDRTDRFGRVHDRRALEEIDAFFRRPEARPAIERAIADADPAIRRSGFRRAFDCAGFPRAEILELALAEPDAVVRTRASHFAEEAPDAVILRMTRDTCSPIRLRGVRVALDRHLELDLLPFATDPHAGIRELALANLLAGDVDVATCCRDAIANAPGRRRAGAILALAAVAGDEAILALRPLLSDPSPTARAAALRALASAGADDIVALALHALADEALTVTRAAREILLARRSSVSVSSIESVLATAPTEHGRRHAVSVLAQLSYWDRLAGLLDATRFPDSAGELAVRALRRWAQVRVRQFTVPSKSARDAALRALATSRIHPSLRANLEPLIRH